MISMSWRAAACALILTVTGAASFAASGDFDENGYVDLRDYASFQPCFVDAGPLDPSCLEKFDDDGDGDIDLGDFAAFQRGQGHLPMPLKDAQGNVLTVGLTIPYSPRQTCGVIGCHDLDERIAPATS